MEVFHKGSDPPPLIFGSYGTNGTHLTYFAGMCTKCVPFLWIGLDPPPLTEYFHNIAKKCTLQVYSVSQKNDPWRNMTIGGICSLFVRYLSTCCTYIGYQGM